LNDEPGWRSASVARLNWLGGAVELACGVVAAADHRAHRAVEVGDHHRRLARVVVAAVLAQQVFHRGVGHALQAGIERCAHKKDALGH
jgi:hypothetical protein